MVALVRKSILITFLLVLITCVIYPASVWIVGQVLFRQKANGSIVVAGEVPVGSRLIGQGFIKPEYFHPRPSAAGEKGYDASNSSGTNLTLTSKKFQDALETNIKKVLEENPGLEKGNIPPDMVTASASGLDPHISLENATAQISRISKARKTEENGLKELIAEKSEKGGLISESLVNVLTLNLELDSRFPLKQ